MSASLIEAVEAMEIAPRLRCTARHVGYVCDKRRLFYEDPAKTAKALGKKPRTIADHFREMAAAGLIAHVGYHPRNRTLRVWQVLWGTQPKTEVVNVLLPEFEEPETAEERHRRQAENCLAEGEIRLVPMQKPPTSIDEPRELDRAKAGDVGRGTAPLPAPRTPSARAAATAIDPLLDQIRKLWVGVGTCSPAEWKRALAAADDDGEAILRGLRRALPDLRRRVERGKARDLRWWIADRGWLTGEDAEKAKKAEAQGKEAPVEGADRTPKESDGLIRTPKGKLLSDGDQRKYRAFERAIAQDFRGDVGEAWRERCTMFAAHQVDLRDAVHARWPETRPNYYRDQRAAADRLAAERAAIQDLRGETSGV